MGREIDPKNLSGGDVLRIVAPLIGLIVAIVVVGRFAPSYFWVLMVAVIGYVIYTVQTLPKKDLEAIAKAEQDTNDKIRNLPLLGPILYPLWRVFGWAHGVIGVATILLVVYFALKGSFQ